MVKRFPDRAREATDSAETVTSVAKACRILRALTQLQPTRLTDIAHTTGLDKATVLRLSEALAREGFVVRDAQTKLYSGGPELQLAGAAALARSDLRKIVRPSLVRLAGVFEDTAILSIPSGVESMCVDLELGRYPIRANYLEIGSRRLLGVGAGSLALLAFMPEREREAALDVVVAQLQCTQRYPRIDRRLLQAKIAESAAHGHAMLLDVVVERMGGIGMPIVGPEGRPVAAISIAAHEKQNRQVIDLRVTKRVSSRTPGAARGLGCSQRPDRRTQSRTGRRLETGGRPVPGAAEPEGGHREARGNPGMRNRP